jgi:hypothetical protein
MHCNSYVTAVAVATGHWPNEFNGFGLVWGVLTGTAHCTVISQFSLLI